ncbi:MAG: shikimate dehydrogenase, partial [Ruminococcus sp.]
LLMKKARSLGKTAIGGSAMLVLQAVKAHELWNDDFYTDEQIGEIISAMEKQICEQFPAKEAE